MNTQDRMVTDCAKDDLLILVDAHDQQVGYATKERVHRAGLLHRAFSVVLWREGVGERELLLAQRAPGKYHSAGLWANSCCSHPRVGESVADAAHRRTHEELGCGACNLHEIGTYVYRAVFEDALTEYEYDHVLLAQCEGTPAPDPSEVSALRWQTITKVAAQLTEHPEAFCAWAPGVLSMALRYLSERTATEPELADR